MVVCKFFQQGSCRYGQNCRFEHIYGSKYSYHSSAPPQAAPATATDEQLIQQVQTDVQAALRGGQWLLSSYAPFKEKPAFPGINDLSFEEARLFIYEAKASNNVDQAVSHMNNLFKEARAKYEQLLLKNSNITRVLRSIYNGENVSSAFENSTQENSGFGNPPPSSIFRSAVQTAPFTQTNQASSIFSQNNTQSTFAQNATPSIFAQTNASPDPAKSIFAQVNQSQSPFNQAGGSVFTMQNQNNQQMNASSNVFGPQTDVAKSIFSQASQNTFTSPQQSNPASLFVNASQSTFNQGSPFSQTQANIFQQPNTQAQTGFGTTNVFQQGNQDDNVYSKMEDLSAEDLEAFNSSDFKMGFVPELPPPQSLCF